MLGSLRVAVDGVEVTRWCGSQGRSLLRYLILNRHKAIPRDVLIDAFWPDTDAAVGRNRLHVALHGLRRDLRTVPDEPIVIQAHGCYALSGTLDVWVDCEEVRRLYSAGCSLEQAGLDEQAMAAYRSAQELVRGELLADAPYDDWSVPDRENQRAFHLEILERLALLQFAHADYDGCIASARQLIGDDLCREDMHRLLMRCYARKGRRHLAALQFKACMRELADELDVTADAETVALDEAIRRRREV
jgi:DNA-binding SARP family transcriptional activator